MKLPVTLISGLLLSLLLAGCVSQKPETAIRKVQMFHLKTIRPPATKDEMIRSETRKRLWGAVTPSEQRERIGNYYAVHWKAPDETLPATVRMEYRQANQGSEIRSQEVVVPAPKGKNVTKFSVIGEPYRMDGRVVSWRAVIEQGGQVVGEETSFLWN